LEMGLGCREGGNKTNASERAERAVVKRKGRVFVGGGRRFFCTLSTQGRRSFIGSVGPPSPRATRRYARARRPGATSHPHFCATPPIPHHTK
jgi:hypothetical protein